MELGIKKSRYPACCTFTNHVLATNILAINKTFGIIIVVSEATLSSRTKPYLVGFSLAPAPYYSAKEAGARKCGFFVLPIRFAEQCYQLVHKELEPRETLPNMP